MNLTAQTRFGHTITHPVAVHITYLDLKTGASDRKHPEKSKSVLGFAVAIKLTEIAPKRCLKWYIQYGPIQVQISMTSFTSINVLFCDLGTLSPCASGSASPRFLSVTQKAANFNELDCSNPVRPHHYPPCGGPHNVFRSPNQPSRSAKS